MTFPRGPGRLKRCATPVRGIDRRGRPGFAEPAQDGAEPAGGGGQDLAGALGLGAQDDGIVGDEHTRFDGLAERRKVRQMDSKSPEIAPAEVGAEPFEGCNRCVRAIQRLLPSTTGG